MSKSKGNVINPIEMIDKYGADALRAALIFGTKEGGDVVLSEQKILGMRNFANKIWNMGRFIQMNEQGNNNTDGSFAKAQDDKVSNAKDILKELTKEFAAVEKKYHGYFKKFLFAKAFDLTYEFVWHRLADHYIEVLKEELRNGNMDVYKKLEDVYSKSLQLLHP